MKAGIEVPAAGRRSQAAVRLGLRCGFAAIDSGVIHCLEVPSARKERTLSSKLVPVLRRGRPKGRPVANSWHILV